MDIVSIVACVVAAVFAALWLVALRSGRAALDRAQSRIEELEARLLDVQRPRVAEPAPSPVPSPVPAPVPGDESPGYSTEALRAESAPLPTPAPAPAPAPAPEPDRDRLRPLAGAVVREAYQMTRYLDFDALVDEKKDKKTYRVTVPLTAANAEAVRYLKAGMFPCLRHIEIAGNTAVLHIDTSKGSP